MHSYPRAIIDLGALKHNLARAKQMAPDAKVMAVIKANAYGHGAIEAARALQDSDAFAVARLAEGMALRQANITQPITLLEGLHSVEQYELAAQWQLSPVIHRIEQLPWITQLKQALPACWLMVETGMHRLGITSTQIESCFRQLQASHNIQGEIGLMTHFANADLPEDDRNQQQITCMQDLELYHQLPVSMANSAAILAIPNSHQQWLRPGIMLYGASPFEHMTAADLDLKPVMTLLAEIIAIEQLKEGDEVGYGGTWRAEKAQRVATVNIGYGDGYHRALSNQGQVAVGGRIVPILGRISMDMICIDVTTLEQVSVGDEVELWGPAMPINDVAHTIDTIPYELLCQLSPRVVREYHG